MDSPGNKLLMALELYDLGEHMYRARLVRERPGAKASEIEREVVAWRHQRPGAELGDAVGRARTFKPRSGRSPKR